MLKGFNLCFASEHVAALEKGVYVSCIHAIAQASVGARCSELQRADQRPPELELPEDCQDMLMPSTLISCEIYHPFEQ